MIECALLILIDHVDHMLDSLITYMDHMHHMLVRLLQHKITRSEILKSEILKGHFSVIFGGFLRQAFALEAGILRNFFARSHLKRHLCWPFSGFLKAFFSTFGGYPKAQKVFLKGL